MNLLLKACQQSHCAGEINETPGTDLDSAQDGDDVQKRPSARSRDRHPVVRDIVDSESPLRHPDRITGMQRTAHVILGRPHIHDSTACLRNPADKAWLLRI